jgi:hypothetical protein
LYNVSDSANDPGSVFRIIRSSEGLFAKPPARGRGHTRERTSAVVGPSWIRLGPVLFTNFPFLFLPEPNKF